MKRGGSWNDSAAKRQRLAAIQGKEYSWLQIVVRCCGVVVVVVVIGCSCRCCC